MPAKFDLKTRAAHEQLHVLGQQLKQFRKANKLSADAVATAAGLSRTTLHRIELGEPSVAAGAYWAVVAALGLTCGIVGNGTNAAGAVSGDIDLNQFPQLKRLAWHVHGTDWLTPLQAWDIYVRNWRHINENAISAKEKKLIDQLRAAFEPGSKDGA